MKILVTVKRVPDPDMKVRVNAEGTGIVEDNMKFVINPFDEIAVEEGLRIKEKKGEGEVVIVAIGPSVVQEQIRAALAMGADRGIHVDVDSYPDPLNTAKLLKAVAEKEAPNIVIMGKQAVDDDYGQAGQMLAAMLGWAQATFAYKVEIADDNSKATVTREVDGGLETIEIDLPAVVTADLRLNEPRYASLPGIMKAKTKPMDVFKPADLGVELSPVLELVRMEEPPPRKGGIIVETVDELLDKLRNEAKVI